MANDEAQSVKQSDGGAIHLVGEMADRDAWEAAPSCSMEKALGLIGNRSTMTLVREAFYGSRRFDDLARRAGVTEPIAARRLKQLVEAGLMERQPYQVRGQRTRMEYVLTPRGRDLFAVLLSLIHWGDEFMDGGAIELRHAGCGERLSVHVTCAAGHEVAPGEAEAMFAARRPRPHRASRPEKDS